MPDLRASVSSGPTTGEMPHAAENTSDTQVPHRVIEEDGIGEFYCYPGGEGVGQVKRDWGDFGTIWARRDDEIGIMLWRRAEYPYTAMPGTSAYGWRSFKTKAGAVRYMARVGRDAYGRPLT